MARKETVRKISEKREKAKIQIDRSISAKEIRRLAQKLQEKEKEEKG